MKITIDFDNKLIIVEQETTIQDLIDKLNSLNINFNEYKILVNTQYIYYPYNDKLLQTPDWTYYTDNIKLSFVNTRVTDN